MSTTKQGLFREAGVSGALFGEVVGVVGAAMRNPGHEGLSLGAVHAAEALARRLAAAGPPAWDPPPDAAPDLAQVWAPDAGRGGVGGLSRASSRASDATEGSPTRRPRRDPGADPKGSVAPWTALLGALALVARHDPRPAVADAAADTLLGIVAGFGRGWRRAEWAAAREAAVVYLLALPYPQPYAGAPVHTVHTPNTWAPNTAKQQSVHW